MPGCALYRGQESAFSSHQEDQPKVPKRSGADAGGEHEAVVMPPVPRSLAELVLTVAVEAERVSAALPQLKRAA